MHTNTHKHTHTHTHTHIYTCMNVETQECSPVMAGWYRSIGWPSHWSKFQTRLIWRKMMGLAQPKSPYKCPISKENPAILAYAMANWALMPKIHKCSGTAWLQSKACPEKYVFLKQETEHWSGIGVNCTPGKCRSTWNPACNYANVHAHTYTYAHAHIAYLAKKICATTIVSVKDSWLTTGGTKTYCTFGIPSLIRFT